MQKIILVLFLTFCFIFSVFAQHTITGKVLDKKDKSPVEFVHVILDGESSGTITDQEGSFSIETQSLKGQLWFQAIGYETQSALFNINRNHSDIGIIYLSAQAIPLDEITITAGLVNELKTPITVSTVSARTIHNELGDRPLPFSFTNTPGVYSVRSGGGSGDAEMSIRGFNQENVGVLLNGVPINGVENGLVYWSNWLGLSQAAALIQIQKGPGFSNVAVNSVGGSINIITEPAQKEKGGSIIYQVTSFGNQRISLLLNSGKLKNGWHISFMGSYTRGPGYVDATYVRGWSYYLAMSKQFNTKHKLTLTLLGAPQRHGQRTLKLSDKEHNLYGNHFNKDWGSYNGKINNASENFYHRPFLGLNHYFKIDDGKKLANSIYLIVGNGGGKWSESFNYAPTIFSYRNPSGQIDWPAIYENNATNEEEYELENGETVSGYSKNVQTHFLASHIQAGWMSTYEQQLNTRLKFVAGIHYRYFYSYLREKVVNLLGGNFFIDDYAWAVDGVAGRDEIKTVGDIIKVNNSSIINNVTGYAQLIYDYRSVNAYISANGNYNWYQRIDRYNYVHDDKSELISIPGFDLRAGIGYAPSIRHKIYANGAFISKAPYFKYVFGNFTNVPVINLKNEQISTIEAGYRFQNQSITANINGFYTYWANVSLLSDEYIQLESNLQTRALINGLNAVHKGVEAEVKADVSTKVSLGGFVIIADYRWKNNVNATLFNNENVAVDTVNVFVKDIYVGGTAQQQFGIFGEFRILDFFNLRAEWLYNNKIFASFNPTFRRDPSDNSQPYQIPAFGVVNIYLGIPFKLFKTTGLVQINGYNILNNVHAEWGEDGYNHDLDSFRGFWSFGRNFDFMLKLNF